MRSGAAEAAPAEPSDTFETIFGTDLVAWYDASDAASITHVAGAVSQWNDKTAGAAHLTQGTAANKPTYSATGLGGAQPSISFDGGDHIRTTVSAVAPGAVSDFAAFVVGRLNAGGDANGRFVSYIGTASANDHGDNSSALMIGRDGSNQAIEAYRNSADKGNKAVTYDTTFRAASVWSGGNHTMYVENVAGTPVADANGNLAATGWLLLGAHYDLSAIGGSNLVGHICEIAFVKVAPSAGQLTSVQTMLAAKWTA
jgi:hypothetical protein